MDKLNEIKKSYLYATLRKSNEKLKKKNNIYNYFQDTFTRIDEITKKPLKLAILGEFSAGKSSFINRLIGINILPTGFMPVTSAITVLEYAKEEKIEVVYKDNNGYTNRKVYEGYDKLLQFQKNKQEDNDFFEIEEIRVFINNKILKYFNIIDTPGFNDANDLSKTTESIFDKINYVIWLFNATQTGKGTEKAFLEKFKQKSLYKDNVYAIVNFGDAVVTDNNQYDLTASKILENEEFKSLFVNDQIYLISSTKKEDFWNDKFKQLENDLKEKVLKKDKEISENQLNEELNKLKNNIDKIICQLDDLTGKMEKEFDNYLLTNNNNHLISKELKADILQIIKKGVDSAEEKIKNSTIYRKTHIESLLKFASFYLTAENLEIMKKEIEEEYKKYIADFADSYEEFKNQINIIRNSNPVEDGDFENEIDKKSDAILSNLNVLQNSKQLLIVGYIIGLLSDDYIYKYIKYQNSISKAVDNLSDGTIYNLLDMDLDLSYFLNEIKNIKENIIEKLSEDKTVLEEAQQEIEEFTQGEI